MPDNLGEKPSNMTYCDCDSQATKRRRREVNLNFSRGY